MLYNKSNDQSNQNNWCQDACVIIGGCVIASSSIYNKLDALLLYYYMCAQGHGESTPAMDTALKIEVTDHNRLQYYYYQ